MKSWNTDGEEIGMEDFVLFQGTMEGEGEGLWFYAWICLPA